MKKILVAETEPAFLYRYDHELTEDGYMVVTCDDSARLMDAIAQERPDLVLVDMKMVHRHGGGFQREIEGQPFHRLPTLYLTAFPCILPTEDFPVNSIVPRDGDLSFLRRKIKSMLSGGDDRARAARINPPAYEQMVLPWKPMGSRPSENLAPVRAPFAGRTQDAGARDGNEERCPWRPTSGS